MISPLLSPGDATAAAGCWGPAGGAGIQPQVETGGFGVCPGAPWPPSGCLNMLKSFLLSFPCCKTPLRRVSSKGCRMLRPKVPATRPQPLAAPSSSASRNQKENPSPAFLHILLFSERGRASSRGVNPNAPVVPGAVTPSLAAWPRGGDGCRGRAGQRRGSLARALLCPVPLHAWMEQGQLQESSFWGPAPGCPSPEGPGSV